MITALGALAGATIAAAALAALIARNLHTACPCGTCQR